MDISSTRDAGHTHTHTHTHAHTHTRTHTPTDDGVGALQLDGGDLGGRERGGTHTVLLLPLLCYELVDPERLNLTRHANPTLALS